MTRCQHCDHEFLNVTLRRKCPRCGQVLKSEAVAEERNRDDDTGFDATGFVLGYATGVPISPAHGISMGAVVGAALHNSSPAHAAHAHVSTPEPETSKPFEPGGNDGGSNGSWDLGSSSSFSSDSGGGGGGGGGE